MELAGARVLVTGGTGFLGRNVVRELETVSANVTGLGSSDYDLRSRPEIDRLLDETAPDAVVHLAAVTGGIGANRAEPGSFFYENAIMGIELLEACRTHAVGKVVVAGTVCSYPKYTKVPFREEDLWAGYPEETNAPYGLAKKMLLVQSQAYREQYRVNAIHLLVVNLYGPGDNFDLATSHVIPAMVRRFVEAERKGSPEVVLWGDGSATREFIHAPRRRRGVPPGAGALRRWRPRECGFGVGDIHSRPGREGGRPRGIRRHHLVGHHETEWPTEPPARHQPGPPAVRLRTPHHLRRRPRRDDRLVSRPAPIRVLTSGVLTWRIMVENRPSLRSALSTPARRLVAGSDGPAVRRGRG